MQLLRLLPLFCCLFLFTGCKQEAQTAIEKISVTRGENQCAVAGEAFARQVVIRVDGKKFPLPGQKIRIEVPAGSDLAVSATEAVTDGGGQAAFQVTAGRRTGDQYVRVTPEKAPEKAIDIRFLTGVQLIGSEQEGRAGTELDTPIGVRLTDSDGKPQTNVSVWVADTDGRRRQLHTNANGEATTSLILPQTTGAKEIQFEIPSFGRPIRTRVLSFDPVRLFINFLGGLAFFIFGMKMMSDGLSQMAGARIQKIMQICAGNRFSALFAGALITAIVQSSSATSVMTIGFVNAGILSLTQAIGIIFGANIGTTITAQIIAFKIGEIALPSVILGILLIFLPGQRFRGLSTGLIGFGLLFYGMNLMSSDLQALGDFPSCTAFFKTFDCRPVNGFMPLAPVLGAFCIGLIATIILQSSSVTTGIVIAMAGSGLIDFYTGVSLVLGTEIGTTITAQLAAIPANRIAKQAALAHTLFNVFGVIFVLISFWIPWGNSGIPIFLYLVDWLTDGNVFAEVPQNLPRHLANAHTFFKVLTAALLFPFIPQLGRLCARLLPIKSGKVKLQLLEPHLLLTPSAAMDQVRAALFRMLRKSWKMVDLSLEQHFIPMNDNPDALDRIRHREQDIDRYQSEIMEYLSKLMQQKLTPAQSSLIPELMHCANDIERIGDRSENILKLMTRMKETGHRLTPEGAGDLRRLLAVLKQQSADTLTAIEKPAEGTAGAAIEAEKLVDELADELENGHICRLREQKCSVDAGIIFVELLSELTAISRHLGNIAVRIRKA